MRSYFDLDSGERKNPLQPPRAKPGLTVDVQELRGASMARLCPGAFDAYKPHPERTKAAPGEAAMHP